MTTCAASGYRDDEATVVEFLPDSHDAATELHVVPTSSSEEPTRIEPPPAPAPGPRRPITRESTRVDITVRQNARPTTGSKARHRTRVVFVDLSDLPDGEPKSRR
ncbi:MAG: hypothetical protein AB2A00_28300 [Myxococcota bacterium]